MELVLRISREQYRDEIGKGKFAKRQHQKINKQKSKLQNDKRVISQISLERVHYNFNILIKNLSMTSSIIPDAKHQELNISFTFDQSQEGKLIINALVDRTPYQTEIVYNLDLDFQDIKNALLSKQFKIISRTPEILKLKIAFVSFEFKNIEKITLNTLKQTVAELKLTITELNSKLKSQFQKNVFLEELIKQLRKEFDSMTTKMSDLRQANDENKEEMKKSEREWKEKMEEERLKRLQLGNQLEQERFKRQQWERLKIVEEQERLKKLQSEKERQQFEEKRVKQLQQRLKKLEVAQRLQEERIKKEMQEKRRLILIQQEEQRKLKIIQQQQQLKLEQERQKEIEYLQKISTQNANYNFSSTHKDKKITLQNNNTKAIMQDADHGLALVEGVVFEKGSSIRFRIVSIGDGVSFFVKQQVCIGIGIKNVIVKNQYQIPNRNVIGHGCFILSSEGYSMSHFSKEHKQFQKFRQGDAIVVTTNGDELLWMNETQKKQFRMRVNLTADEWGDACFCVHLYEAQVQILK